jgi:hypothetical protein
VSAAAWPQIGTPTHVTTGRCQLRHGRIHFGAARKIVQRNPGRAAAAAIIARQVLASASVTSICLRLSNAFNRNGHATSTASG